MFFVISCLDYVIKNKLNMNKLNIQLTYKKVA